MISSIEGNFEHPEVNELLTKHFIELRAASPEGSAHVLDIPGLKIPSIKFIIMVLFGQGITRLHLPLLWYLIKKNLSLLVKIQTPWIWHQIKQK